MIRSVLSIALIRMMFSSLIIFVGVMVFLSWRSTSVLAIIICKPVSGLRELSILFFILFAFVTIHNCVAKFLTICAKFGLILVRSGVVIVVGCINSVIFH